MNYISVSVTKVAHLDVRCLICDQMVVWKGAVSFLAASRRTSWQRSWIYRRGGVALLKAVAPHAILRTHSQGGLFSKGGKKAFVIQFMAHQAAKWLLRFLLPPCMCFFFWYEQKTRSEAGASNLYNYTWYYMVVVVGEEEDAAARSCYTKFAVVS